MISNTDFLLKETNRLLDVASGFWTKIAGCSPLLLETDQLRRKLHQPCVLAVGGKVKAGKSSFINALLGKELAKVGELETTATINMFRHISEAGVGYTPERPVKVVWDSGVETWESVSFMDSLQGNDDATLKKAEGISHLEFYVEHELLRELTLVDTPGTGAVVGDDGMAHENVADRFFRLRQKHNEQTDNGMANADAVIYLVGAVANASNKKFLEDFQVAASGASAINALGVLSKVDIDQQLLENRQRQAESVADSLRDTLYTVIPVSAGLHEVFMLHKHRFPELMVWLKHMPPSAFKFFMRSASDYVTENQTYLDALYKNTNIVPPSVEERKQMKGDIQWALYRTVLQVLYEADDIEVASQKLKGIANIEAVSQTINDCFFNRSKIIRCNSVLHRLYKMVSNVRRTSFDTMRTNRADLDYWMKIIQLAKQNGLAEAADGLRTFITNNLPKLEEIDKLENDLKNELLIPIEELQQELVTVDGNFRHLTALHSRRSLWPEGEYEELCTLFGLYGKFDYPEGFDFEERQAYWQTKSSRLRDKRDRAIAEYAVERYGQIMNM